jgi:AraC-like DNA-binding protein
MKLYIRNMACESCKIVVRKSLEKLNIQPIRVELGEADIKGKLSAEKKLKLNREIGKAGLQIVESKESILVERIRQYVIEYVNMTELPTVNFSDYLSEKLEYDYTYLSNKFSQVGASSIMQYMNAIKMERAKEMILFEDMSLQDVAERLHYASLSSFSAQFKKMTGLPPSHYKKLKEQRRRTIQDLITGEEGTAEK